MNNFLKKNRILTIHLVFWGVYFSFFFYQISAGRLNRDAIDYSRAITDAIVQTITLAGISYFNYFVLLPRYSKSRNWLLYATGIALALFVTVSLQLKIKYELYDHADFFYGKSFIIRHTINAVFVIIFVAMLRFAAEWFDLQTKKQELENEKLTSELRFLKEQINPHFLFNTLNNLYYLAHSQSPKTKDVVAKLSQMMRYMIYDATHDRVPVAKEITYIENYIDLERMRLEDDFPIIFDVSGNYDGLMISPFIFITFLENAFKHGLTEGEDGIFITLKFEGNRCTYTVKNQKATHRNNDSTEQGIGLSNIRRRLNLIYPGHHELSIQETENTYLATLMIELSK